MNWHHYIEIGAMIKLRLELYYCFIIILLRCSVPRYLLFRNGWPRNLKLLNQYWQVAGAPYRDPTKSGWLIRANWVNGIRDPWLIKWAEHKARTASCRGFGEWHGLTLLPFQLLDSAGVNRAWLLRDLSAIYWAVHHGRGSVTGRPRGATRSFDSDRGPGTSPIDPYNLEPITESIQQVYMWIDPYN